MTRTQTSARMPRLLAVGATAAIAVSALTGVASPPSAVPAASASVAVTRVASITPITASKIALRVDAPKARPAIKVAPRRVVRPTAAAVWLDGVRRCISWRESNNIVHLRPNYAGASGLYQFIKSTWHNYKGYSEAYLAPEYIQTQKFYKDWAWWQTHYAGNWSRNPWNNPGGKQCW